jgi:hypothetical protein
MWFYAAVMYVYALRVEKQQALIWDENVYPFRWYVRNFVKLLFYLVVIGWVVQMVVQVLGLKEQSLLMVQLKKLLHGQRLIILIMSLTAGITEEFLFRGYIFSRLEKLFNLPTNRGDTGYIRGVCCHAPILRNFLQCAVSSVDEHPFFVALLYLPQSQNTDVLPLSVGLPINGNYIEIKNC